jgi:lipopolysaccharide/colanic/teichoic acid biosynthesis glycosyltransferase
VSDRAIRLLDVVFSGTAILLLSPLLLALILILRLTGEGEIFFRQQRVGADGRMFDLLKFATMLKNSPYIGTGVLTLKDDPRILPVGRLLRKTKLNELPQLFNVLLGDMSLIGPRPQAPPHFEVYPAHIKAQLVTVRPGLSGIGSIVFRDEEEILDRAKDKAGFYGNVIAPYKGELEVWFIQRKCIRLYVLLLFLTVGVVLFPSSALHRVAFRDLPRPPSDLNGL